MLLAFKGKFFYSTLFFSLFFALWILAFLSTSYGDVSTPIQGIFSHIKKNYLHNEIIYTYRLPRTLTGMCVGAGFALSGCLFQAAIKNPLASPNVIGVNSGASFFAILGLIFFQNAHTYIMPLLAFIGALSAVFLVYFSSWKQGISQSRFILAGIIIDVFFQACSTGLLILHANQVGNALVWLSGSLWGKDWNDFYFIFPCFLAALTMSLLCINCAQMSHFDDNVIKNFGINPAKNRLLLVMISSLICAVCVSTAGPIGSISLIVPHLCRILFGLNYKLIIPFSALFGSIIVVLSDFIGRTMILPNEIPVGIILLIIGSPYFLYLILKVKI